MGSRIKLNRSAKICIFLFISTFLIYMSLFYISNIWLPKIESNLKKIDLKVKGIIDKFFDDTIKKSEKLIINNQNIIKLFSTLEQNPNNKQQLDDILRYSIDSLPFSDIFYITASANIIFSLNNTISKDSINNYGDTFQKQVSFLIDQSKILLVPLISKITSINENNYLFFTFPIYESKKFIGIVVISILLSRIIDDINQYLKNVSTKQDIILAQKNEHYALKFFSTQKNHNKVEKIPLKSGVPITLALLGNFGGGIIQQNENKFLTIRDYIINSNWAMVAQKNVSSLLKYQYLFKILLLIFLILFSFTILLLCFFNRVKLFKFIRIHKQRIFYVIIFILECFALLSFLYYVNNYRIERLKNYEIKQSEVKSDIEYFMSLLLKELTEVYYVNHSLAIDFSSKNLTTNEQAELIKKQLINKPYILSVILIQSDPANQSILFEKQENNKINIKLLKSIPEWHNNVIKENKVWLGPIEQKDLHKFGIIYAEKIPNGVIATLYSYDQLQKKVLSVETDFNKDSFIVAKDGKIVFYQDVKTLLDNSTNIEDIINITQNKNLKILFKNGTLGYSSNFKYYDKSSHKIQRIFYEPIPISNWTAFFYFDDSKFLIFTNRTYQIILWLIIIVMIMILLFGAVLTKVYDLTINHLKSYIVFCSITIFIGTLFILILSHYYLGVIQKTPNINKNYIDRLIEEKSVNKKLLPIKVGIEINYLKIVGNKITFIAQVWQKIHGKEYFNATEGVNIKNMIDNYLIKEKNKTITNDTLIQEWEITGNMILLNYDMQLYPLDTQIIEFIMEPKKPKIPIILIPDVDSYKNFNPLSKPGISTNINMDEFEIKKSYFSNTFKINDAVINNQSENLAFDVVLQRKLLDAFLRYLLPLCIIIVALFCLLILVKKRDFKLIQYYTGLSFSMILIHYNLRTALGISNIVYLEYFILIVYFALTLACLDLLIKTNNKYYNKLRNDFLALILVSSIFIITFILISDSIVSSLK